MPDHSTPEGRRCNYCPGTLVRLVGGEWECSVCRLTYYEVRPTPAPAGGEALFTPEVVAKLERAMARVPDTDRAAELLREARAALAAAKPPASPADDPTGLYYPLLFLCEAVAPVLTWLEEDDDETATPTSAEGGERLFVSSARQEGKTEALRRAASPTLAATGGEEDDAMCGACGRAPGLHRGITDERYCDRCAFEWAARFLDHYPSDHRWARPAWRAADTLRAVRGSYDALRRQLAEAEEQNAIRKAAAVEAEAQHAYEVEQLEGRATTAERRLEEREKELSRYMMALNTPTASQQEVARLREALRIIASDGCAHALNRASHDPNEEWCASCFAHATLSASPHQSTGQGGGA